MKTYSISKRKVIVALMSEPLGRGCFFEDRSNDNCKVCAVGAVLRACGVPQNNPVSGDSATKYKNAGSMRFHIKDQLAEGNYLGALSIYHESESFDYESATNKKIGLKHRMKLANFVLKNFPSKITFDEVAEASPVK